MPRSRPSIFITLDHPVRFAALLLVLTLPLPWGGNRAAPAAVPAEGVAAVTPPEGAPATASAPARKVLVLAKVKEEAKRRNLEDEVKVELQKKGVETLLGSDVMTEDDFASLATIRAKVESLGVDGVIGYVVLGIDEKVKTSSATLSVGIGGGGYSHGGGMGVFVGGSVPLGTSTKVVRKVHLRARYFARPFEGPAWEKQYDENLPDDTTRLAQYLAADTVKSLKKKKLIPAK